MGRLTRGVVGRLTRGVVDRVRGGVVGRLRRGVTGQVMRGIVGQGNGASRAVVGHESPVGGLGAAGPCGGHTVTV